MTPQRIRVEVPPEADGQRVDHFLASQDLGLTRSQAERLAKAGRVSLGGHKVAAGHRVAAGQTIEAELPERSANRPEPEPIPLDVLFEDEDLLVIDKPSGLVVHPTTGRDSGTLVNALLGRGASLARGAGEHRPGIVHRLDKDTSGLLVVAKTDAAYEGLSGQIRRREVDRRYWALVWGNVQEDRLVIDVPIGRHRSDPTRMAAVPRPDEGRRTRSARTDVRVLERYGPMTLVEARLETGRTHQIRVHLAHEGYPVVGDPAYGIRRAREGKASLPAEALALVRALKGQALHAHLLRFRHPSRDQEMTFTAPMPADMAALVGHLQRG